MAVECRSFSQQQILLALAQRHSRPFARSLWVLLGCCVPGRHACVLLNPCIQFSVMRRCDQVHPCCSSGDRGEKRALPTLKPQYRTELPGVLTTPRLGSPTSLSVFVSPRSYRNGKWDRLVCVTTDGVGSLPCPLSHGRLGLSWRGSFYPVVEWGIVEAGVHFRFYHFCFWTGLLNPKEKWVE